MFQNTSVYIPHQIPSELSKAGGRTNLSEIRTIFNSNRNKEELPEEWKRSIAVAINTKGNKIDCSNYRGISLLSTTYNNLSSILLSNLSSYAEEIIGDHQ